MKYGEIPESLEKLNTPIIICDERGLVIYKNTAAVQSVRLPRRNTSILTHLGQTEQGELRRLSERKKPSVLTVQTGDRNARALVVSHTRAGKPCSLWVFISLLQTGTTSGMFAELDAALCSVGREICEYVKSIDTLSLELPEQPDEEESERLERRLTKIIGALIDQKRGWLFELGDSFDMLFSALDDPMRKYGYQLSFQSDFPLGRSLEGGRGDTRLLVDLQSFFTLYLHLILFCCDASPLKQLDITLRRIEEDYYMEISFTLPYPPFYTEGESSDLSALTALSPKNRFEILLFEAYARVHGYEMSYRISHEAVNNMYFRVKLPLLQKYRLRSGDASDTEQLFVKHDLILYFWHIIGERLKKNNE